MTLRVQHTERFVDIEPVARAWIAEHHGVSSPAVRLRPQLLSTRWHAWPKLLCLAGDARSQRLSSRAPVVGGGTCLATATAATSSCSPVPTLLGGKPLLGGNVSSGALPSISCGPGS